jgi:hypothetical protein
MAEMTSEEVLAAQLNAVIGKPILLRPSVKLRQLIEEEADYQKRSLNNLVIIILERYFKARTSKPRLPIAER